MSRIKCPKVSVIIPTYNRANYVTEAINSVLSQTYTNFEIIVVDDGSTDNTKEALRPYMGAIRYIYQPNSGPSVARNRGVREATSEFIAFLDSDDVWLPEKLEKQIPLMMDDSVVLSYSNHIIGDTGTDCFTIIGLNSNNKEFILERPLQLLTRRAGSGISTPSTICRKNVILHVGGFDQRMKIAEDVRMWFRLSMEGKFAITTQPLTVVRRGSKEHLTNRRTLNEYKECERMLSEVFLEAYARAIDEPKEIQNNLRRLIGICFVQQAKLFALERNYKMARRRAFESLVFWPKERTAIKAIIGLFLPQSYHIFSRKFKKSLNHST
jgi:glycosyltransferase involved in cell wall biosynthesis